MLFSVLALVLRRSLSHWKLLTIVTAGVIFAAALASSTAIYADAIRDLGLSYALRQVPRLSLDLQVSSTSYSERAADDDSRRRTTLRIVNGYAGRFLGGSTEYGHSATFYPTAPGDAVSPDEQRPRSYLQYQDGLADHVRVVDGALTLHTDPESDPTRAPTIQVVVGEETAARLNVHLGDRFALHPYWRPESQPVTVVVAGVIAPRDPSEEYWMGKSDRFSVTSTTWRTYPFFVDRETLTNTVAAYLPDTEADVTTLFYVRPGTINAINAGKANTAFSAAISQLRQQLPRTTPETAVPDTVSTFFSKLFFSRLPLFALMVQVIGIVLYYIVMVSTMVVDRQTGEIALMKSRGAGIRQVMVVYALEGAIIAVIGAAVGPLLAGAAIRLLGPTPPFHNLSDGNLLTVRISVQALALAGGGALLSLAAILWPAYRATRYTVVLHRLTTARPEQTPAFFRYYLDVFLIIVAALLFYELRQRGSLVTQQIFGNLKTDPLLLISPALFMLTIALLFLRLFPLALHIVARVLGPVSGPGILLGLWHMVRRPVHYSRLILLLILATSLGMFAAGFRATLDQSYRDRAAYTAGAPVRASGIRFQTGVGPTDLADRARGQLKAEAVMPAARLSASYSPKQFRQIDTEVLGVDPATFGKVTFWRDDFAGASRGEIERTLQRNAPHGQPGVPLPDGSRWIGVWVRTPSSVQGYAVVVRLVDRTGRIIDYTLTNNRNPQPTAGDWTFFAAPLEQPFSGFGSRPGPPPAQPLSFVSLYVRSRPSQQMDSVQDFFDNLQVTSDNYRDGQPGFSSATIIEDFEDPGNLELVGGVVSARTADSFSRSEQQPHDGAYAGQLSWTRDVAGMHGVRVRDDGQPIVAYASKSFLIASGLRVGQTVRMFIDRTYVDVRIAGSFTYFPTFAAGANQNLIVTDLARLQYATARTPGAGDGSYTNELWVGGQGIVSDPDSSLRGAGIIADHVVTVADLRAAQQRDPLVAASWEGILFLSFAAVLMLAALGFIVYSLLSARERSLEFAVLRTLGLSRNQIVAVVGFEQLFVTAAGVLAGTVLGFPLSRGMIGYMGVTETGNKVVPPFVSSVSWQAVATTYLGMAVVFVAATIALILLYARLAVSRALRLGDA